MANIFEEKLREASCVGDIEAVRTLLARNVVDVNSRNPVNGWTALHWACCRGNEQIVQLLLDYGADKGVKNSKNETASDICTYQKILGLLGVDSGTVRDQGEFVPHYLRNPTLNPVVDIGPRTSQGGMSRIQQDELVLRVRIHNSPDPDFIEIELPHWQLTYNHLVETCCTELQVDQSQIERIRKLPDTRLRNDNDIKRLINFQSLELVLKNSQQEPNNSYQSISLHKDQTVLY